MRRWYADRESALYGRAYQTRRMYNQGMEVNPESIEDQLETFRQQWSEEVQGRRLAKDLPTPTRKSEVKRERKQSFDRVFDEPRKLAPRGFGNGGVLGRDAVDISVQSEAKETQKIESVKPEKDVQALAVKMYEEGTQHERNGNVSAALSLYQRAFKLDENVDQHWRKLWQSGDLETIKPVKKEEHVDFAPQFLPGGHSSVSNLAEEFSNMTLHFNPKKQGKTVILEKLPNEVLICVLQQVIVMDVYTLISLGLVCKKMYLLTREQTIWRSICENVYRTHSNRGIIVTTPLSSEVSLYGDWKRMYLAKARIRFDGVYISRIHYWRPGMGDSGFNQPFILVTYFRYLRFYQDGSVISLCTSMEPSEALKLLKSSIRSKNMMVGTWTFGTMLELVLKDLDRPRTEFKMALTVHSPRFGQWNQIRWSSYTSKTGDGEVLPFPMKDLKNFYFSRVKSFT
jgi:F-box protein 9